MPRIKEKALTTELAKHGFESVSVTRELPGGRVEVEANKLHPVHVEGGESIYAPMPTDPLSRLQFARNEIDRVFGAGYAAAHSDVVAAVISCFVGLRGAADCPQPAGHRRRPA
jgi:hypothetical protein